jgi:hypothetical protein
MHVTTYLRIFIGGLFPSRLVDGDENTEGMRIIQRKNWTHLGIAVIIAVVLTYALWILTDMFLSGPEHMFLYYNVGNIVFLVGTLTISYLTLDWAVRKTLVPASIMKNLWPNETEQELELAEGDYQSVSEELSERFWKCVDENGMGYALLKEKKRAVRKPKPIRKPKPVEEDEMDLDEIFEDKPKRYSAEAHTAKVVADQNQKMLGLAYVSVGIGAILLVLVLLNQVKNIVVAAVWIVALVLIAGIAMLLLKMNSMKESKKLKAVFNVFYAVIILAILGLASAWSFDSFRNSLLAGAGLNNLSGLSASISGALPQELVPTIALPAEEEFQNTPTPTMTLEMTQTPEPVKEEIIFAVGEYSLEVKEKTNEDMAEDISVVAESVNSIVAAYVQATSNIKASEANMAEWSVLCYGSAEKMSITEVSFQNRSFLTIGMNIDGKPVLSYFERLTTLKETGAIKPEDADQLEATATLLNAILEEHEALCLPLVEMETMAKSAGRDYSLVDEGRIAELFSQAKEVAVRINDIAAAFNDKKQEAVQRLNRLEGPDGQELIDFLEKVYPASTTNVYITATPGAPAPNVVNTLLPPTATATPAPTQNACWSATTIDEGKSWLGYEWGIEDYLEGLRIAGSMDVEKYIPECTGFVFSFPVDVTGDGVLDWGIMQEIGMKPALNQYAQVDHSATNFKLVLADDPLWPNENKDYVYREDNGDVIMRDWPIPPEIQPTATQRATEVSGCHPSDTGTYGAWNKIPMRWQELAVGLGGEGRAKYHTCLSNLHYVTVEVYGKYYWFNQNDAPTSISQDRYFWINWSGVPYYWSANPVPTPTPPSAEMCRPGRSDVFTDSNKLNISWSQLDTQFPDDDVPNYAWYFRCRPDSIYVVVMDSAPGDTFTLYWLTQSANPSNVPEGTTFWVENGNAYVHPSQFDPPAK